MSLNLESKTSYYQFDEAEMIWEMYRDKVGRKFDKWIKEQEEL